MRQKALLFVLLPLVDALSLANFQDITSILIPLTCQFTYDSQIPTCTADDFQDPGCSAGCAASLTSVAKSVTQACSDVNVNSNTLLGIIKNGGILQALCPTLQKTTTSLPGSTTPAQESAQPTAADSVTLPTASPGVQVPTTASRSTSTLAQSASSTTHKSSGKATSSQTVESTAQTTAPASSAASIPGSRTSSKNGASLTSADGPAPTKKTNPQSDTGGGSPFDISSNIGHRLDGGSILAFVVAAWAGILLGR